MKKATVFFLLSILMIFSVSCGFQRPYHFLNSLDEVKEIMIVKLTFEDKEMMQTDLQRIENTEVFLEKFQQIPCHRRFGDPTGATEEGVENVVFRISYLNGEYELIDWYGKSVYTLENGFKYYAGYDSLDEQAFELLIQRYRDAQ